MITTLITFLILAFSAEDNLEFKKDICLSKSEVHLVEAINKARRNKGKKKVAISKSLTYVAKLHAEDLSAHELFNEHCNPHSWSDEGEWEPCCYTENHSNAECMWKKPSELTDYKSEGYEIVAFWQSGENPSEEISADKALQMWLDSRGHSDVIFNGQSFRQVEWNAIGVAIHGNYASVWFGVEKDDAPPPQICSN